MTTTESALGSRHGGNPVGRFATDHPGLVRVARGGWVGKGVLSIVAGLLALVIAVRASSWSVDAGTTGTTGTSATGDEASASGAIERIAESTGGVTLLWLLALGMFLYAAWRLVSAFLPGASDAMAWAKRAGYLLGAGLYTLLGITAVRFAQGSTSSSDGNRKVSDLTARVMDNTGGRWLIGLVGAIVIGVGLYRLSKGAKQDVGDELDFAGMSTQRVIWSRRVGAVGEVGRGVSTGLIGLFLVSAAVSYDPDRATGLDGALRRLADETWGLFVVAIVGIGLVAYGLFCLATFTHRRLEAI